MHSNLYYHIHNVLIINGLDECHHRRHDKAIQQLILHLLCKVITVHKLSLRFLIGSHPESLHSHSEYGYPIGEVLFTHTI